MATSDWAIPTGKAITGATYIKDTDDNIAATIEDLRDWCNNANGTYTDWTLTGLRTDFVDVNTAQTITAVKTIDTLGAIDFTGGELRIGSAAVTSSAAELNKLDGATATTAELNILDGVTATTAEINKLDGLTASTAELNILDGVTATATDLNKTSSITSGTYTPTVGLVANASLATPTLAKYTRVGDIVTVYGRTTVDPISSGTVTQISISLPVSMSGNFTSIEDASGMSNESTFNVSGEIYGNTSAQNVILKFTSVQTGGTQLAYSFMYRII